MVVLTIFVFLLIGVQSTFHIRKCNVSIWNVSILTGLFVSYYNFIMIIMNLFIAHVKWSLLKNIRITHAGIIQQIASRNILVIYKAYTV